MPICPLVLLSLSLLVLWFSGSLSLFFLPKWKWNFFRHWICKFNVQVHVSYLNYLFLQNYEQKQLLYLSGKFTLCRTTFHLQRSAWVTCKSSIYQMKLRIFSNRKKVFFPEHLCNYRALSVGREKLETFVKKRYLHGFKKNHVGVIHSPLSMSHLSHCLCPVWTCKIEKGS